MSINIKGQNLHLSGLDIGVVKKDLGATFANATTEFTALGFDKAFSLAVMENTNATGAGVRLYVKANGVVKYVALS